MEIKSDHTPKQNSINNWLQEHKSNEILKWIIVILSIFIIGYIMYFFTLDLKKKMMEHEKPLVEQILNINPVIKYQGKYYLPMEYELVVENNRNKLEISGKGLKPFTIYLTDCKLILNKTKENITDNFIEAVYKKRGLWKVKKDIDVEIIKPLEKKELPYQRETKSPVDVVHKSVNKHSNFSFATSDFFQRKTYADGYTPLVTSFTNLNNYKETDEYKALKRFQRTKELEELNSKYNLIRSKMWTLHYAYGLSQGSFEDLEQGKLSVKMIQGKLEFSYKF